MLVASVTAAAELALRSRGTRPGSEVLLSALSPAWVVVSILRAGLRPLLVDVDPLSGEATAATLHLATARTRTGHDRLLLLHRRRGPPPDLDDLLLAAAVEPGHVVQDATVGVGAHVGTSRGSVPGAAYVGFRGPGALRVASGALLWARDQDSARWVRRARDVGVWHAAPYPLLLGTDDAGAVLGPSGLDGPSESEAAVGRQRLRNVDASRRRRLGLTERYDEALSGIDGVHLVRTADSDQEGPELELLLPDVDRETVASALRAVGVRPDSRSVPLHRHDLVRGLAAVPASGLPGADQRYRRSLRLPLSADPGAPELLAAVLRSLTGGSQPLRRR